MPRRDPLPRELVSRPFSTREARALGVSADRLRSSDMVAPYPGARTLAAPETLVDLARSYAARMHPSHFFSHCSAALLWGAPLPSRRASGPIDVCAPSPGRAPEVHGVRGRQLAIRDSDVRNLAGLRVTSPELTWCCLASVLGVADLVAIGDFFVTPDRRRPALTRPQDLARCLTERPRLRGARTAWRALDLVRSGSASRPESLVRLVLRDAGLPEPDLNTEVRDASGRFLGIVDLAWPEYRVGVEYEGDYHRTTRGQFHRDIQRIERFADDGWTILRVSATALFDDTSGLAARVARRLTAHGWRGQARELRNFGVVRR